MTHQLPTGYIAVEVPQDAASFLIDKNWKLVPLGIYNQIFPDYLYYQLEPVFDSSYTIAADSNDAMDFVKVYYPDAECFPIWKDYHIVTQREYISGCEDTESEAWQSAAMNITGGKRMIVLKVN